MQPKNYVQVGNSLIQDQNEINLNLIQNVNNLSSTLFLTSFFSVLYTSREKSIDHHNDYLKAPILHV